MTVEEYNKALKYALRLLSLRDRSETEIRRNLFNKEYDTTVVSRVLSYLKKKGFLNDERFACNWAEYKVENSEIGSLKIDNELRKMGVDDSIISKALQKVWISHDEFHLAHSLAMKKIELLTQKPSDKELKRICSFLLQRGFPPDIVDKVMNGLD